MHQFAAKWNLPASLHVPGAPSHPATPDRVEPGTLAELIRLALETLPEPVCRRVRIECGEMLLGYEAMRRAYYSVYFPLPRGKPTRPPE